jgi:hypothetical protein
MDMHALSSDNVNAIFDGMVAGAQQTQDAYQQTINTFQSTVGTQQPMNEPRRADYFQQTYQPSPGYQNGFTNPPVMQAPRQDYGFGYDETSYATPYGSMFGGAPQPISQDTQYFGFYNPAYGK